MRLPVPASTPHGPAAPGNMGDVRRSNLSLVLGAIAGAPRGAFPTRAHVAAATGLTKASVSSMVTDLLDAGLVREIGLNPHGRSVAVPGWAWT